jgi:hypothetical protein
MQQMLVKPETHVDLSPSEALTFEVERVQNPHDRWDSNGRIIASNGAIATRR